MKILAANKFFYLFGGSDRYFFELNQLYEQAGHHIIPFAMRHPQNLATPYEEYFVSEVNYWNLKNFRDNFIAAGRIFYSYEANRKIRRLIENTYPDIAHIHSIYHQISPSILPVIKEYNIPIVQTLHDYKPICPTYSLLSKGKICERCQRKKFYNALFQRCSHNSLIASFLNMAEMYTHHAFHWYDIPDIYIAPSNFMRTKMIEFGMQGKKIVHIPNFIDISQYEYSGINDNYFIYLGRLHKIKGIKTLILAMNKICKTDAKLLLIGDGPQRFELEALTEALDLSSIIFCGFQSGKELFRLIRNAMFNVLPSECYENCPMSILELMAMGKPTVGSRIGGIPELIEDEVDGLLFETGNVDALAEKINYLMENPSRCVEMGHAARKKVRMKYNSDVHYKQVLNLYKKLV